jgi:hypothetical protein
VTGPVLELVGDVELSDSAIDALAELLLSIPDDESLVVGGTAIAQEAASPPAPPRKSETKGLRQ